MWKSIKDLLPVPGEIVEIRASGELLKFIVGVGTVYNVHNNLLLRFDEIEIWRHSQEKTEEAEES